MKSKRCFWRFNATLILCCFLSANSLFAQDEKTEFYVHDENMNPTTIEKAHYLTVYTQENDTTHVFLQYFINGPLIRMETYRDKNASIPHGRFVYYDAEGRTDSTGSTFNGKKDRWWVYYSDSLKSTLRIQYDKGKEIYRKDLTIEEDTTEEMNEIIKSGFVMVEKEAEFKGGVNAWIRYLTKNIKFPERAKSLDKQGRVMINFMVNTDGVTADHFVLKSIEYSLDHEALRLIKDSPKWEAAIQNGKKVNAYRSQPITFKFY